MKVLYAVSIENSYNDNENDGDDKDSMALSMIIVRILGILLVIITSLILSSKVLYTLGLVCLFIDDNDANNDNDNNNDNGNDNDNDNEYL